MKSAMLATGRKMRTAAQTGSGSHLAGIVVLVPFVAILAFHVWLGPRQIVFKAFGVADVLQMLTILFLVALLAERALEIFIGTWRSPAATDLERAARDRAERLADLEQRAPRDEAALAAARAALEDARREERQYRCVTKQIAMFTGLALGLLVSAVGLRAVGTLVDPAVTEWSQHQMAAFNLVDVVLTGGIVAGGSEGVHRLATVFDNFMTTTAKKAKSAAA